MRLTDSVYIAVRPQDVWPLVTDPILMSAWNCKIVAVDRAASGSVQAGERFSVLYRMSGRDRESHVEVVDCHAFEGVTFRHRLSWRGREQVVDERYDISPEADGVRVVQIVDLQGAGLPWYVKIPVWLITRFGWQSGPSPLQQLKTIAESPPVQAGRPGA